MVPRRILAVLVGLALLLPIVVCVLVGVGRLLSGMGDSAGEGVLDRLALAVGIALIVDLIVLVVATGVNSLGTGEPPSDEGV